jgi:beta-lactamase regulating signal transducer with metallopeptidase domain
VENLFTLAISNSVAAGVLAVVAVVCARLKRNPQLTHALWLLVLIKLVTPPIAGVPVPDCASWMASDEVGKSKATLASEATVATSSPTAAEVAATSSGAALAAGTVEAETTLNLSVMETPPEVDLSTLLLESPAEVGPAELTFPPELYPGFAAPEPNAVGEIAALDEAAELPVELTQNIAAERAEDSPVSDATPIRNASTELPIETRTIPRSSAAPGWTSRIGEAVFFLWCFGTALSVATLFWRCFRFRKIPRLAGEAADDLQATARQFAAQLGLRRCPRVVIADVCIPPLVWGMSTRPVIVLPRTLLDTLDSDQKRAVLMHELAHVRRRDYVVRWIEAGVLSLFWWNPLAWWARRQLREAEEECCDAWVVWALPDSRKAYGQALLKTVEFLTESPRVPVVAGTTFGGSPFKRRIEMILNRPVNRTMSRGSCALVLLLAVAVLPLAAQTATDPPAGTKPDTKRVEPAAPGPLDERETPTPGRDAPLKESKPRDPNFGTGTPDTPRFSRGDGGRARQSSGVRRPQVHSSSGPATNVKESRSSTEEKTLEALARMEDRIMQLEKIVKNLAFSQLRSIERGSTRPDATSTRPAPQNKTTSRNKPTDKTQFRDALIAAPGTAEPGLLTPSASEPTVRRSNQTLNRRIAVSPNGRIVAALTWDARTTQVDLFDIETGLPFSRFAMNGTASSVEFLDDGRLSIRGEKTIHLIAVPTGNLIKEEVASRPSSTPKKPKPAPLATPTVRSYPQSNVIVTEYALVLKQLETTRDELGEKQKSLQRDARLLDLEVQLVQTKLAQEEATFAGLLKSGTASETDIEKQKLAMKQASLEVEKEKTVLEFKMSALKSAKAAADAMDARIRKTAEDFIRRYPNHSESKKYREFFPPEESSTPTDSTN